MSNLSLTIGATFNGRYRVVRCMAHGGMGAVYEVIHLETERRRALKVMLPHLVQSPELRDRFRQEARVAAKIESKYIVDVFDAGIDDPTGMPFLVMELLKGEELGKRLERLKRLPAKEVVKYLQQTASALDKTHSANIVHRDLKPENLFLHEQEDEEPRIKVLDFGIAKIVAEHGTQANATRSVGTPLYMAPEQFKQGSQVSPATDIYALGMMAYTLLVGRPYWEDEQRANDNVFAFVASVMHGPKEKATVRAGRRGVVLAPAFDTWFSKVTNPVPQQRYASAKEAIAGLAEALGLQAPEASRVIDKTELLGAEGSRIKTVKMMPDIRAAVKAGGASMPLPLAPPSAPESAGKDPAVPAPRPPMNSALPTEQLPPAHNVPVAMPQPVEAPPTAPPTNAAASQTGPSGIVGMASTRPSVTQAKRSNAPVFAAAGFVGLLVIGGGIVGLRAGKTPEDSAAATSTAAPSTETTNTPATIPTPAAPPIASSATRRVEDAPPPTTASATASAGPRAEASSSAAPKTIVTSVPTGVPKQLNTKKTKPPPPGSLL